MDYRSVSYDLCREYVESTPLPDSIRTQLLGWIRNRDLGRLTTASGTFGPDSRCPNVWRSLLQVEAFFKKNVSFVTPSTETSAIQAFMDAERRCKDVNLRLTSLFGDPEHPAHSKIELMRGWIQSTLGDVSKFYDKLPMLVRLTSGATATTSRQHSLPMQKVRKDLPCTPFAFRLIQCLYGYWGINASPEFVFGNVNRIVLVPKNWKTHRTIACEPAGNLPFQLAFDSYAKARLRRRGIDLSDQTLNQRLALQASVDGSLSTIDLEAASDSVSAVLVEWLFPPKWYEFLNGTRSFAGRLPDGTLVPYEKYASMGNGTTFAVETLIFAAACFAVGATTWSVYGDDIIVDSSHTDPLVSLLGEIGFRVNEAKSFTAGPFRESCGMNACLGSDVTPFYFRDPPTSPAGAALWVNGIGRIWPSMPGRKCELLVRSLMNQHQLPLVPSSENPCAGVHVTLDTMYKRRLLRKSRKRWVPWYKGLVPKRRVRHVYDYRMYFLWHLHHNGSPDRLFELLRDLRGGGWEEVTSRSEAAVPSSDVRYKRGRVWFNATTVAAPDHLYWWSDWISSLPNGA